LERGVTSEQQPAHPPSTDEMCPECGATIPAIGTYCPNCGAIKPSLRYANLPPAGLRRLPVGYPVYYPTARRSSIRQIVKGISAYVMLTFIVQLILSMVILVYGVDIVAPEIMDGGSYDLFVVVPVIVTLMTLSGPALLAYYFLLIVAILVSCSWVLFSGFGQFRKELSMTAESRKHSAIFATLGLLFATLFFSVLVALIANPSADELPEPGTLASSLFSLANASVWEELIVRVLMIGLPMILVDLVRNKMQPKWHSYILGGKFGIGIPEVALVLISSFIFGIAHFASGWGAWKIIPTTVGGVAFGYLFLRYGIAASIVMHFSTDYLGMPMEVIDSFGLQAITGIAVLLWIGFGALFFAYYSMRVVEFVTGRKLLEPTVTTVPYPPSVGWPVPGPYGVEPPYRPADQQHLNQYEPPPPQGFGEYGRGYVCPACGSVEARWVDGKFQCLRCGHLS